LCLFFTHIAVEIKGSDYIWGYSGAAKCNTNLFTDVNPNRWGEPMSRPQRGGEPPPFRAGGGGQSSNTLGINFSRLVIKLGDPGSRYLWLLSP
jgi:hypothetical protein